MSLVLSVRPGASGPAAAADPPAGRRRSLWGAAQLGQQALVRVRQCGWLTEDAADKLACHVLARSAWELWPSYAALGGRAPRQRRHRVTFAALVRTPVAAERPEPARRPQDGGRVLCVVPPAVALPEA